MSDGMNIPKEYMDGMDDKFNTDNEAEAGTEAEEVSDTDTDNEAEAGTEAEEVSDTDTDNEAEAGTEAEEVSEVEPSAEEQIKEQEELAEKKRIIKQVKTEIFDRTGLKVDDNDPMLQLVIILKDILDDQLDVIFTNIEANTENLTDNLLSELEEVGKVIAEKQNNITTKAIQRQDNANKIIAKQIESIDGAFEGKLSDLQTLLDKLEDQKESIINDVWGKLEQRITDKIQNELTKDIKTIAENSNNSINNQRMLLVGGIGGLVIGLILCAIILGFFV